MTRTDPLRASTRDGDGGNSHGSETGRIILTRMRVALGSDHAGVSLKDDVKRVLDARGIQYTDFGTLTSDSVDYPDFAAAVGEQVAGGAYDRGILV